MNITSSLMKNVVDKPLNMLTNTRVMNTVCKGFQNNDVRLITGLGLLSIVLKDGLGCYMYVKQSLNNKNIPEEKRKFVAALDLANGGLMIAAQILMFMTISNKALQSKWFEKMFGKFFDRAARKGYQEFMLKNPKYAKLSNKDFNAAFEKCKSGISDCFGALTSLVAATVLAKRVIVPFIATPLAEIAKGFLGCKKDEPKSAAHIDTKV